MPDFPWTCKDVFIVSIGINVIRNNAATADVTWVNISYNSRNINHGYGWTPSSWASAAGIPWQTNIKGESEL